MKTHFVILTVSLLACGGKPQPNGTATLAEQPSQTSEMGDMPSSDLPIPCGQFSGPAFPSGLVDADPGYLEKFEALSLTTGPDMVSFEKESAFGRAVLNFMLGTTGKTSISRTEALAAGKLGHAVLAAAAQKEGDIDFSFLRQGLHYFYTCSRPFPPTLETFKKKYGDFAEWTTDTTLDCSKPKNGPRRIHINNDASIYVAETRVGDSVRETEIIFKNLRNDGQLDFAVYQPDGKLSDRSTFAAASGKELVSAAPYTCVTCHRNSAKGDISTLAPTGLGAGCQMK